MILDWPSVLQEGMMSKEIGEYLGKSQQIVTV